MAKGLAQLHALADLWPKVEEATRNTDRLRTGGPDTSETMASESTQQDPEEEQPEAERQMPDPRDAGPILGDRDQLLGVYKVSGKYLYVANPQGDVLGSCTLHQGENPAAVGKQLLHGFIKD